MAGCRRMVWAIGFLSAALCCPGAVQAQGRGGFGGGGMAGPGLLGNPAVQKELKLSNEQTEKVTAFAEEFRSKARESMSQLEGLEGEERMKKQQEIGRSHHASGMKDLEAMLKPEQTKRFKQIVFQARGIENLTDPEVAKALKVTGEQADKVKGLVDNSRSEMREVQQSSGSDRQVMMEKFQAIRKEINAKAMALMTADQKTMYKEMSGEPFEIPAMGRPAR